ncbi:MAG: hypothetical protein GY832_40080 [Chloroflexi bacterium]|nr:hypothetical protein [Chloroflexota bacterium]
MYNRRVTFVVTLVLCSLLLGCESQETPQIPPDLTLDQMPISLAQPFFDAGYELVGYYEIDVDGDGVVEAFAVLTLEIQATSSFLGSSAVALFDRHEESWFRADNWKLNGVNANAELRDVTGDELPELLVRTEAAHKRPGDFVTPLQRTDHLSVFVHDLHLAESGVFSNSLACETPSMPTVEKWQDQPAIQTVRDLPSAGFPLWQPTRVETFAWNGQEFASMQVEEQRRISPVVSWVVRRHALWTAVFLALGGVVGMVAIVLARRRRWQELRVIVGLILLLVAGGIGLGIVVEWMCVPALIAIGLVGLGVGRQTATRLGVKPNASTEEVKRGE